MGVVFPSYSLAGRAALAPGEFSGAFGASGAGSAAAY